LCAHYSRQLVFLLILLLVIANTINIAADIAAMGEGLQLLVGGGEHGHALVFGALLGWLQLRLPYRRLAEILKWLCLVLLTYVAVLFYVRLDWSTALRAIVLPQVQFNFDSLMMVVALMGTTISPYLFFWQASQEVQEMQRKAGVPLLKAPARASSALLRIRLDTTVGMVFSNLIALAIMLAAAATLHVAGQHDIGTSAQAAQALRPLAGEHAFVLFALGIIGSGLLAVPVLAGSAAYAVAELLGWKGGLDKRWAEARGFYSILIGATLIGTALDFTPVDPIKALFYSAVVNGLVAVPVMTMLMLLASNARALGPFAVRGTVRLVGWLATVLMLVAVLLMLYTAIAN
jgi:Mn2+/Fe2+ NRAMP family transporter